VVLTVPAIGIGVMAAPAVGGFVSSSQEFNTLLMVGGLTVAVSLFAGYFALRTGSQNAV
jgi:hypothetical protein